MAVAEIITLGLADAAANVAAGATNAWGHGVPSSEPPPRRSACLSVCLSVCLSDRFIHTKKKFRQARVNGGSNCDCLKGSSSQMPRQSSKLVTTRMNGIKILPVSPGLFRRKSLLQHKSASTSSSKT